MRFGRLLACGLLALSLVFSGCATLPSTEVMKAETATFQLPKQPEPEKAIVYVVRPSGLGGLIRFNVFVDDQQDSSEVGYTRASQYIWFNLSPGEHKIFSKAENWAETTVKVAAGDIVYLQQEPAIGLLIARNNLTPIDAVVGKYHVKTLQPGTMLKPER